MVAYTKPQQSNVLNKTIFMIYIDIAYGEELSAEAPKKNWE